MTTLQALVDYGDIDRDELFDNHTADLAIVRGWCDCAKPAHPIVIVRATVNPDDPPGPIPATSTCAWIWRKRSSWRASSCAR